MLHSSHIKVALVLMHRAPIKGDEARDVTVAIDALTNEFQRLSAYEALEKAEAGNDDTGTD